MRVVKNEKQETIDIEDVKRGTYHVCSKYDGKWSIIVSHINCKTTKTEHKCIRVDRTNTLGYVYNYYGNLIDDLMKDSEDMRAFEDWEDMYKFILEDTENG